ncbi:MAG TPA: pyridoxamine 5'-phosphate oxidase family protein [Candidatus Ornithocaccomicrobium faecavium]|uniref:Pyridoxamine 5'-phosphate oxidase family protein n=1 Tax=Candidatus Ornithocaccomicrobium faecavium TaxID=2840890 RepID=A0A9D1P4J8_9FIRM|nr:pyridoxamine 5'-phosphate oxidase family protein [Candidatus Ornithocaccomicrobium faecavium]
MIDPAAERILQERFGKDSVIALATLEDGQPSARFVNAYYEGGAFYSITHAHSGKMRQIAQNPAVGIAADWFTAHGVAENLGYLFAPENAAMAAKLKLAFAQWFDNGHNDYADPNTILLRVRLTDGVLLSHGTRYALAF